MLNLAVILMVAVVTKTLLFCHTTEDNLLYMFLHFEAKCYFLKNKGYFHPAPKCFDNFRRAPICLNNTRRAPKIVNLPVKLNSARAK